MAVEIGKGRSNFRFVENRVASGLLDQQPTKQQRLIAIASDSTDRLVRSSVRLPLLPQRFWLTFNACVPTVNFNTNARPVETICMIANLG